VSEWWDEEELPPRARRSPVIAVIAVLVVFGLVAGVIEIAVGGHTTRSTRTPSSTPSSIPTRSELDAIVKLLDDAAFSKRIAAEAVQDEKDLLETQDVLRALGLLPAGVDLKKVLTSFLAADVAGFYDPKSNELVVRGAAITPYVRTTLAHELTHALDDQHFELDRPGLSTSDDETGLAFQSLVEGNAVRIEEQYKASMSKADRDAADAEEARLSDAIDVTNLPPVIPALIAFPYAYGPALASKLAEGGEARVNAAFKAPPITSEQVVHPESWLKGDDPPVHVATPKSDGTIFDQGALGYWGVLIMLEGEVGARAAQEAAEGWGGDWYVAWRTGSKTCVRAAFAMDTPGDLRQLGSALDDWAASQADADVTRSADRVMFTACA
jgi:hypothetical protein